MKQSVQMPLATKSENVYRSMHPMRAAKLTASQREFVGAVLRTQLERVASPFIVVTLVRISSGVIDDDNLRGALKAVRDEVAKWLGIDDGCVARIRFEYSQQICPRGYRAVRVEVDDGSEDRREVRRVVGANPPVLRDAPDGGAGSGARGGAVRRLDQDAVGGDRRGGAQGAAGDRGRGGHDPPPAARRPAADTGQQRLAFLKSYAMLPWAQRAGAAAVATRLRIADDVPPETLRVPAPDGWCEREFTVQGRRVRVQIDGGALVLFRHRYRHARLGECWMYLAERQSPGEHRNAEETDR